MRLRVQLNALLAILLWNLVFLSAAIAPSWAISTQRFPSLPFQIPQQLHEASDSRPLFTRLRDEIIRCIWSPSPKLRPHNCSKRPITSSTLSPPSKTIARYGGDVVLRFRLETTDEAMAFSEAANVLLLDIWEFTNEFVDVRIAKDVVPSLLGLLPASLRNAHALLMHDLAQIVFESYPSTGLLDSVSASHGTHRSFSPEIRNNPNEANIFFQSYQPLSVIVPWMRLLQSLFPTHVRLTSVGISYEGRDIPALRVGVHPTNSDRPLSPRKTVIVAGGSHAREWISTSTVNFAAFSFITSYGKSKPITKLIEEFDWIFIPTLNPDGYIYTWENDRLWRKNRQNTDLRFCKGLDLDRTWGFEWDGNSTKSNPCSESFSGDGPFQGFESRQFADWVQNETEHNNAHFFGFLDFHSYSQQVLYPYSYSCINSPPSLENLEELAAGLAKAIRHESGEIYGVTSACEGSVSMDTGEKRENTIWPRIETGGGSALDWFYHEANVKYTFQIKLRDRGSYGFLLPAKNIVPTGKEAFAALTYLGHYMLGNKGIEQAESMQEITSHRTTTTGTQSSRPGSLFNLEDLATLEPTSDMNDGDNEEISDWEL